MTAVVLVGVIFMLRLGLCSLGWPQTQYIYIIEDDLELLISAFTSRRAVHLYVQFIWQWEWNPKALCMPGRFYTSSAPPQH